MHHPPCSAQEIARKSAAAIARQPGQYLGLFCLAALPLLMVAALGAVAQSDAAREVHVSSPVKVAGIVAYVIVVCASHIGQLILGSAATMGLGLKAQAKLLVSRFTPMLAFGARAYGAFWLCMLKAFVPSLLVVAPVALVAPMVLPDTGRGETFTGLAVVSFLFGSFWAMARIASTLTLAPALVVRGDSAKDAVAKSRQASTGLGYWLFFAYLFAMLPGIFANLIGVMSENLADQVASQAAQVFVLALPIAALMLVIFSTMLMVIMPMVALMAIEEDKGEDDAPTQLASAA